MSDASSESKRSFDKFENFDEYIAYRDAEKEDHVKKTVDKIAELKKQKDKAIVDCVLLENRKKQLINRIAKIRLFHMKHPDLDNDYYVSTIKNMYQEHSDIIKEIGKADIIIIDTVVIFTFEIDEIRRRADEICRSSRLDSSILDSDSYGESD